MYSKAVVRRQPPRSPRTMLVWRAAGTRYASPLEQVAEVLRAAAIVPAAGRGPVIGHLDLRGAAVPVVDPRQVLLSDAAAKHQVRATDRFVLLDDGSRRLALVVDDVEGLREVVAERPLEPPADLLLGRLVEDAVPLLTVVEVQDLPEADPPAPAEKPRPVRRRDARRRAVCHPA